MFFFFCDWQLYTVSMQLFTPSTRSRIVSFLGGGGNIGWCYGHDGAPFGRLPP